MRRFVLALGALLLLAACTAGTDQGPASPSPRQRLSGEITPPQPGTYVYDLTASSIDPDDPDAPDRRVEGEQSETISVEGDVYSSEITIEGNPGFVTVIRTRWEERSVLLLSSETTTPDASSRCTFEPPVEIVHLPTREERFPTQEWDGPGCQGRTDITVLGAQTVRDATGRAWATWKFEVRTETTSPGGSVVETETRWLSPELGRDVRTDRIADGERSSPTGTRRFHNATQTVLKSNP